MLLDAHSMLSIGPELHFAGPPDLTHYLKEHAIEKSRNPAYMSEKDLKSSPEKISAARFLNRLQRFGLSPADLVDSIDKALVRKNEGVDFVDRLEIITDLATKRAGLKQKQIAGLKVMKMVKDYHRFLNYKPDSKVIHIVRDGRDVSSSQIRDFGWGYKNIELAAVGWSSAARSAINLKESGLGHVVRYEDLITSTAETLRGMLEFIGVPYEDTAASLNYGSVAELGHHPSASAISQGINSSSIGRHNQDLSGDEIRIFNDVCREELDYFGYA